MGFKRWIKRAGHKAGGQIKRSTRKASPALTRIGVYTTGVVAAAASYFFTPVAGAAVTAIGGESTRYLGTVKARSEGKHGKEARDYGRVVRKRAWIAGAVGTSLGGIGGLVGPGGYATGSGVFGSGSAVPASGGVGSIYGDSLPALVPAAEAAPLPALAPSAIPGLVTAADLGLTAPAASSGLTGVGWLDTGLTALGGAGLSAGAKALGGLLGPSGSGQTDQQPMGGAGGLGGGLGGGSDVPGGSETGDPREGYRHDAQAQEAGSKTGLYLALGGLAFLLLR